MKLSRTSAVLAHAQGFRDFLLELRKQDVRVLVTSRCQLGGGLPRAEQLHLSSLSEHDAIELLRQRAGRDRLTPPQAQKLASICGNNALALTLIGGFIASQAVTAEVRRLLRLEIAFAMETTAAFNALASCSAHARPTACEVSDPMM